MVLIAVALLALMALAGVGFAFVGGDSSSSKAVKRVSAMGVQTKVEKSRRNNQDVAVTRRKQILTTMKNQDRAQRKQSLTLEARG